MIYKRLLSLFISFVMLFNLTAELFAAPFQLVSEEQQRGITSTLSDAYNNSSHPSSKDLGYYQNQYENALEKYVKTQEKYEPLYMAIAQSEALMEFGYESLSKETLKECDKLDQTDEQFNAAQDAFNKKIEKLGGVEKLNEKYKQWEEYNKDYTEIEKAIAEQEKIIETNTAKLKQKDLGRDEITAAHSAIKTAKDNIKNIQKGYSNKYETFKKLTKELTEIAQMDSDIENEGHRINGLHDVCEMPIQAKELLLAGLADLPGAEELTGEMDLKDLLEKSKELSKVLEEEKEKAEQKYQQTEQALNEAAEKELNNRIEKYFIPASNKICLDKQEKQRKETGQAVLGLKNGQRVPIEQDSVTGGSSGQTITAEVHAAVGFNLRKEAELSCVNQPWTENLLKHYNAGITMEELSYIKYGEYMATYGLEDWDGKNITASEAKERGYELAKVVILYALGNLEAAVVDHNQLMGDYYQAKHLMNFLEQDWQNQDYGTIQKIKEDDWYEDEETGQMIEYQKKTLHFAPSAANKDLENSELIKSYVKRRIMFLNTKKILEQYFWELNDLLVDIMSYLAQEDVKPSDLPSILNNLGIPLSVDSAPEEYKQYVKDLIVRLNKESNVTDKEKVSQIAAEYAKERPEYSCAFEKRIDDMWTGWQNAKTTYDENERRIKIESYDWNHAESIKNLLAFNARMLPKYNYRYKKNLEAWNALGEKLRDEKAIDLLQYMVGLGHLISPGTDEKVMYKIQHYDGLYEESVKRDLEQLTGSMSSTTTFGIVAEVLENLIFVALGAKGSAQFSNSLRIGTRKMLRTGYKIALNSSMSRVMKKGYTPTSFRNIRRLSGKINNVTKEINDIKIRRDKVAKSGGKYHFSSSTGWVKEEALKGSFLHQFEKKFANFTGLDVQPYRSTMFGSTKTSGSLASSFNPQKSEKPVMPRNNNKLSPEEIAQNKKAFQQNLAKVNTDLCGGHFRGAACVIVPMPQGALDVATGKASVTQVLNRNPYTSRLVNKTAKNTMKRMETEGLSVEQANKAFAEELNFRLEKSPFMPKARRQSIMRDVDSSLGLKPSNNANVERLSSAEKYGTSSSSMGHQPVKPGVNNPAHSAGLHGDVGRLDNIAQNMAGGPNVNSKYRQYLTGKGFDARDIEEFSKVGLLDDANYSKVKDLLDNGVDKMEIYNAAKTGKNGSLADLYKDKVILSTRRTELLSKGLDARDIEYFEKVGLLDDVNYSKTKALLEKGVDKMEIYSVGKNGGLDALHNTKIVESSRTTALKGLDARDIEAFKKIGLLDDTNYSKVKDLLDNGVDKMEIYSAGKNGVLDEVYDNVIKIEPRKKSLVQRGFTENDIINYENIGLLNDENYPRVETLLNNKVDKVEIFRAYKNGTLDDLLKAH